MSTSITVAYHPYRGDHRNAGQVVLPATESLQYLARYAAEQIGVDAVMHSSNAKFLRFIDVPDQRDLTLEVDCVQLQRGLKTSLGSKIESGSRKIRRTKVHVQVEFGASVLGAEPDTDGVACLYGPGISIEKARLYSDLVPFGPAFQNVCQDLWLTDQGALGWICVPKIPGLLHPLGNPLVIDAAFHLACAWGQRYLGQVLFPTGYRERGIHTPCVSEQLYFCRVVPVVSQERFEFDIYLFSDQGRVCEWVLGVNMQDVSKGRWQPASWIRILEPDPLQSLRQICPQLKVMELATVQPFYQHYLTAQETQSLRTIGSDQRPHFVAVRMALKQLYRDRVNQPNLAGSQINTLTADGSGPCLPSLDYHCSADHDDRFVVAAAGQKPLSVAVENLSNGIKGNGNQPELMDQCERQVCKCSGFEPFPAVLRIRGMKKSVAKAMNLPLAQVDSQVRVVDLGGDFGTVQIADRLIEVRFAVVCDHFFAVVGGLDDP